MGSASLGGYPPVPEAEAAVTRGPRDPGAGAWRWNAPPLDNVSTPPKGGAQALSSGLRIRQSWDCTGHS